MKDKFTNRIILFFQNCGRSIKNFFQKLWAWILYGIQWIPAIFTHNKPEKPDFSDGMVSPAGGDSTIVFDANQLKKTDADVTGATKAFRSAADAPEENPSLFKKRERPAPFWLGAILTTVKVAFLALIILVAVAIGAVFGVANAYLGTTPELDIAQISDQVRTSYIYDDEGQLITTYAGVENQEYASLDEIPELLQQAVIAVEDVRFYHHSGVDLKRLLGAFVSNMSNSSVSGGSTITQQLIKNQLLSPERSYKRKIQEASLALELETKYSKEQILEAYLNTIPLGGTNIGVKAAAMDYFGKELDELTLRECACLAGVTQYPYAYNPRRAYYVLKDTTTLDKRINTVLERMYTAGHITLEEKEAAANDTLVVREKSTTQDMYDLPHFVEYAVYDVVTNLLEARNLEDKSVNRAAIENELRTKGYKIYTTVDREMQTEMQDTFATYDNYPKMRYSSDSSKTTGTNADGTPMVTIYPQVGAVVMDQSTGQIKAMVGSRTEPTAKKLRNRAYQNRVSVGSTIKPLAVYGPALDKGAGLGTIIANIPAPITGWTADPGYPKTSHGNQGYGPVTIRTGIKSSLNIVAARTLADLVGLDDAYDYLVNLGVDPSQINKDLVGLAMGSSGVTPLELTAAYACIANAGEYIEPISFTKVEDSEGNILLEAENCQERRQVFKPSTAYMLVDAMTTATASGTGTRARLNGMTTAGKTGTVTQRKGMTFAGITPYYTSAVWVGHDDYKELASGDAGRWAAPLWKAYMTKVVEGLSDKDILPGTAADYGVTRYSVCSVSGKKAVSGCPATSDYFAVGTMPTESCDVHVTANICTESNELASEYCPAELVHSGAAVSFPEDSPYLKLSASMLRTIFPNLYTGGQETCHIHTAEWAANQQNITAAIASAQSAISSAQSFMQNNASRLTSTQIATLNQLIANLNALINSETPDATAISSAASALNSTKNSMEAALPDVPSPSPSTTPVPSPSPSAAPSPSPSTSDDGNRPGNE